MAVETQAHKVTAEMRDDHECRVNLGMIVAMTPQSGIGRDGTIPWYHREDLRRFRDITMGCPLIMGRKTWESLPKKPLSGRFHIILTRNPSYTIENDNVRVVHTRNEAIAEAERAIMMNVVVGTNPEGWVWVIGGEDIFQMFSQYRYLRRIEITRVPDELKCDKYFPHFPLWFKKTQVTRSASTPGLFYLTYESRGPDDEIVRRRSFT